MRAPLFPWISVGIGLGFFVCLYVWRTDGTVAAWVQAGGAIAAILAGVWLQQRQTLNTETREAVEMRERQLRSANIALELSRNIALRMHQANKEIDVARSIGLRDANTTRHQLFIRHASEALQQTPIFDIGSTLIATHVMSVIAAADQIGQRGRDDPGSRLMHYPGARAVELACEVIANEIDNM
jgi:hypothetical protein